MRDYAKTGSKKGMPAYRTPASFKNKKIFQKKQMAKVKKR